MPTRMPDLTGVPLEEAALLPDGLPYARQPEHTQRLHAQLYLAARLQLAQQEYQTLEECYELLIARSKGTDDSLARLFTTLRITHKLSVPKIVTDLQMFLNDHEVIRHIEDHRRFLRLACWEGTLNPKHREHIRSAQNITLVGTLLAIRKSIDAIDGPDGEKIIRLTLAFPFAKGESQFLLSFDFPNGAERAGSITSAYSVTEDQEKTHSAVNAEKQSWGGVMAVAG